MRISDWSSDVCASDLDRRSVAPRDHQSLVVVEIATAGRGVDLIVLAIAFPRAFRSIGVGGFDRRANVFETDSIAFELERNQVNAAVRQRTASEPAYTDAVALLASPLYLIRDSFVKLLPRLLIR